MMLESNTNFQSMVTTIQTIENTEIAHSDEWYTIWWKAVYAMADLAAIETGIDAGVVLHRAWNAADIVNPM